LTPPRHDENYYEEEDEYVAT